jgi:hypothetical protein
MRQKAEIWQAWRGNTQTKGQIQNPENIAQGVRNGGWNLVLYIYPEKLTHFQMS